MTVKMPKAELLHLQASADARGRGDMDIGPKQATDCAMTFSLRCVHPFVAHRFDDEAQFAIAERLPRLSGGHPGPAHAGIRDGGIADPAQLLHHHCIGMREVPDGGLPGQDLDAIPLGI
jgi:hypothetical protein